MTTVKVSSQVEEKTWEELKILASESQQSISGLLTEAIAECVQRRRVRPEVQTALVQSINDNKRLGELLAQQQIQRELGYKIPYPGRSTGNS